MNYNQFRRTILRCTRTHHTSGHKQKCLQLVGLWCQDNSQLRKPPCLFPSSLCKGMSDPLLCRNASLVKVLKLDQVLRLCRSRSSAQAPSWASLSSASRIHSTWSRSNDSHRSTQSPRSVRTSNREKPPSKTWPNPWQPCVNQFRSGSSMSKSANRCCSLVDSAKWTCKNYKNSRRTFLKKTAP